MKRWRARFGVGIVKNGTIVYERYMGLANLQHQIPVDRPNPLQPGIGSQTIYGIVRVQTGLGQQTSLEADLRQYLPQMYPALKTAIPAQNPAQSFQRHPGFLRLAQHQRGNPGGGRKAWTMRMR